MAAGLSALAVTIPNSFSAGQVISAAALNANFTALKTAVDALEAKPTTELLRSTAIAVSCETVAAFTNTYTKIADLGTFDKQDANSTIELTFTGRLYVQSLTSSNGAIFELRVDNNPTATGRIRALVRSNEVGGTGVNAAMNGVVTGLPTGTHTVSIWVMATNNGSGTEAFTNPGCFGTAQVLVKEMR
ncbi:hypothetical protein [Meiothermus sp.]|uniref:hypothetical protein n=1 Tax=Meiothermus sp. TaxID=1955249 RepID=UPI0021DD4614|nr:hypothetical protein [Meiothermus sp.]GIW34284.1 MAG: hypothetical protein KatS3mg072_1617 [Meiothermus sp.]